MRSVVVLTRRGGRPPPLRAEVRARVPGESVIVFRYRVVRIHALAARTARRRWPPEVWVWLPAMRGATAAMVRATARALRRERRLSPRRRALCIALLALVTGAMFDDETARRIFEMDPIFDTPGVRAMMRDWARDLERRAREAASRKAREEHTRTLRAMLVQNVRDKVGRVPRPVATRIGRCADPAHLKRWIRGVNRATERAAVVAVFGDSA